MTEEVEKLTEGSPRNAAEPDARPMGDVMIDLAVDMTHHEEVGRIITCLESRGWRVHTRCRDISNEDSSDGIMTGKPVIDTHSETNNVINGVSLPVLDDTSSYKVVRIVRPEDRVEGGDSGILYLMNGDGDVKEYLEHEGHLVVDDEQKLHDILVQRSENP